MENQIENVLKLLGKHVLIHMEHNTGVGGFIDCRDLLKIISLAILENRGQTFDETFEYCPSAEPYSKKFNKLINEQVQKVAEI